MRRAPDEAVHRHFQGEVFALDQATHRAVNVHEKATDFLLVNFLIFSFFFLLAVIGSCPTVKDIGWISNNDRSKWESAISTSFAMKM